MTKKLKILQLTAQEYKEYLNERRNSKPDKIKPGKLHFLDFYLGTHSIPFPDLSLNFYDDVKTKAQIPEINEFLVKCGVFLIDHSPGEEFDIEAEREQTVCMYIRFPHIDVCESFEKIMKELKEVTPSHVIEGHYITKSDFSSEILRKSGFCFSILKPWANKADLKTIIETIMRLYKDSNKLAMNEIRLSASFWEKRGFEMGVLNHLDRDPRDFFWNLKIHNDKHMAKDISIRRRQRNEPERIGSETSRVNEEPLERTALIFNCSDSSDDDDEQEVEEQSQPHQALQNRHQEQRQQRLYHHPYEQPELESESDVSESSNSEDDDIMRYRWDPHGSNFGARYVPGYIKLVAEDEFGEEEQEKEREGQEDDNYVDGFDSLRPVLSPPPTYEESAKLEFNKANNGVSTDDEVNDGLS